MLYMDRTPMVPEYEKYFVDVLVFEIHVVVDNT